MELLDCWPDLIPTDDTCVKAENTTVAAKVSGYHHEVLVGDNETVKAGRIPAPIVQRGFERWTADSSWFANLSPTSS
jgi:multidrug resistance efflux pump